MKLVGTCRFSLQEQALMPWKAGKDFLLVSLIKKSNELGLQRTRVERVQAYCDKETNEMAYLFYGAENETP